jgi:GR25 family glycosyltransferase involved in LPS biosynthesis
MGDVPLRENLIKMAKNQHGRYISFQLLTRARCCSKFSTTYVDDRPAIACASIRGQRKQGPPLRIMELLAFARSRSKTLRVNRIGRLFGGATSSGARMIGSWKNLDMVFLVINMQKSAGRRSRMELRLSERGIQHRFIDAIDGDDATAVQAAFTCRPGSMPRIYSPREKPIRNPELACTLSHMRAIHSAHSLGLRQAIICEDDIEIGDVDAAEIGDILAAAPADAAYIQLCVTGAETVHGLAQYYIETGQAFAQKVNDRPTRFVENVISHLSCHCAAAYVITAAGMENICEKFFDGARVVFPCHQEEIKDNVGLIADRFLYQAAASESYPGYAYCVPTFLIEGNDSTIHPDHVEEHRKCRNTAELWRRRFMKEYPFSRPWYTTT